MLVDITLNCGTEYHWEPRVNRWVCAVAFNAYSQYMSWDYSKWLPSDHPVPEEPNDAS